MAAGVKLVATWLHRSRQRVYSMTWPRERGGTGGFIPAQDQPLILACARSAGIDLTHADFFGGGNLPPLSTPANDNLMPASAGGNANPAGEVAAPSAPAHPTTGDQA